MKGKSYSLYLSLSFTLYLFFKKMYCRCISRLMHKIYSIGNSNLSGWNFIKIFKVNEEKRDTGKCPYFAIVSNFGNRSKNYWFDRKILHSDFRNLILFRNMNTSPYHSIVFEKVPCLIDMFFWGNHRKECSQRKQLLKLQI